MQLGESATVLIMTQIKERVNKILSAIHPIAKTLPSLVYSVGLLAVEVKNLNTPAKNCHIDVLELYLLMITLIALINLQ